jgi:hypothetical protein
MYNPNDYVYSPEHLAETIRSHLRRQKKGLVRMRCRDDAEIEAVTQLLSQRELDRLDLSCLPWNRKSSLNTLPGKKDAKKYKKSA